ncbi:MAG: acetoin utilization protein AcuC [Candidatus Krumholzibacteria bacterium]|nr:acetoin utilization protein AcuC [Candidatus Krumholzibacteria bacterium]
MKDDKDMKSISPARDGAVFINSDRLGGYSFSPEHPFRPERVKMVHEMCERRGLFSGNSVRVEQVEEIEDGLLERFHTKEYIDLLRDAGSGGDIGVEMLYHGLGTMENPIFRDVYDFAALSVTASVRGARIVAEEGRCAFNPCGGFHHAHRDRASGFCYVNDIVIAIDELLRLGARVAYLDVDAHHGDGVQEAFYDDPGVMIVSLHESGKTLFPWGGFEKESGGQGAEGFNINIPMLSDTDDETFLFLFRSIVLPALNLFSPDIVVLQAGTDTFATDPLTHLKMTNNGYIEAIGSLHAAFPRILALGGGGYNMADVVRGWTLLWAELAGVELDSGYGGALGGVLLGDASIDGSDLRDMQLYTTGPAKEALRKHSESLVARFEKEIKPLLRKSGSAGR